MATQPIPYQEPQDTKEIIIDAATHLFARQGYDGTSIRDIVHEAGVTKPVLYYYFKNKEDLYIHLIKHAYEFFFTEIRTIIEADKPFETRLKQLMHLYINCTDQYEDTVRIIYNAAFGTSRNHPKINLQKLEEEHLDLLKGFFEEGIREKTLRKMPLQNVVMHYVGITTAYTNYRLLNLESLSKDFEKSAYGLFMKGTGAGPS